MGYKMPNVVKEIFLPCDENWMSTGDKTFEDYKKEYGIDLEEIFSVNPSTPDCLIISGNGFAKIYFVALNYADFVSVNAVRSMNACEYNNTDKLWRIGAINFNNVGETNFACGLVLDFENKKVSAYII